jgi:hypothetical protein
MDAIHDFQKEVSAPVLEALGVGGPWLLLLAAVAGMAWLVVWRRNSIAEAKSASDPGDHGKADADDEWGPD